MKKNCLLLSIMVLAISCQVKPQEINYGADGCSFCKMTIVDKQHAAQLVTTKGKAFKYDAIECMMNHLNEWDQAPVKLYLVSDYATPEKLVDAKHAHYLIDENIPSPMGANLSAFEHVIDADKTASAKGEVLNWDQLFQGFRKKK